MGALREVTEGIKEHAPAELTGEDREPVELAARVIAHAAHRVPGARKVAKMMEGREAKSGVGSDLFALAFQLAERNEDTLKALFAQFANSLNARKGENVGATDATGATGPVKEPFPGASFNGPGANVVTPGGAVTIVEQEVQQ